MSGKPIQQLHEVEVAGCEDCPLLERPDYDEAIGPGPFPRCRHPLVDHPVRTVTTVRRRTP